MEIISRFESADVEIRLNSSRALLYILQVCSFYRTLICFDIAMGEVNVTDVMLVSLLFVAANIVRRENK